MRTSSVPICRVARPGVSNFPISRPQSSQFLDWPARRGDQSFASGRRLSSDRAAPLLPEAGLPVLAAGSRLSK